MVGPGSASSTRSRAVLATVAATALLAFAAACGKPRGRAAEPPAVPQQPQAPAAGYLTEVTGQVGIDFVHEAGITDRLDLREHMGAGVALFDADGDGDLDVYFTNGDDSLRGAVVAGGPSDKLYRQEAGGRFVDATAEAGLGGDDGYGTGVAVGDYDNDGRLDLYVANIGLDRLYRNVGGGRFEDVTEAARVAVTGWSSSAAFFDYDVDGYLDLYVCRYAVYDPTKKCQDNAGRPDYCGPWAYQPVPDVLLHNERDGTFRDVTKASGIDAVTFTALGVVCEDFTRDGRVDVYVANDGYAKTLWVNQGDGTFRDQAVLMGAAFGLNGEAQAGMGVIGDDLSGDTLPDGFSTHLYAEPNVLYVNVGGRSFTDETGAAGLGVSSMKYTGFGAVAIDVELDGDLDLFIANGRVNRGLPPGPKGDSAPPFDVLVEDNLFYLNEGDLRYRLAPELAPAFTGPREVSRALTTGDLDRDGDLDLVLTNVQGPARVYRNDALRQGHWLVVRAVDPALRRDAYGAEVTVRAGSRRWMRTITPATSFQSSREPIAHFGLGPAARVDAIEVLWPDGLRESFPGGPVDRRLELRRGTGTSLDG